MQELIDAFREPLQQHLADEIDTLLALSKYDFDPAKLFKECHEKAIGTYTIAEGIAIVCLNHDRTFEDGIHGWWPPIPVPGMSWFIRRVATWKHAGWWKFASCDAGQLPQGLAY
jgi:hypothetical protein